MNSMVKAPNGGFSGTFTNTLKTEEYAEMDPDPFPAVIVGDPIPIVIDSGTGRFSDAIGELYFVNAFFSPAPDGITTIGSWELVGTITY